MISLRAAAVRCLCAAALRSSGGRLIGDSTLREGCVFDGRALSSSASSSSAPTGFFATARVEPAAIIASSEGAPAVDAAGRGGGARRYHGVHPTAGQRWCVHVFHDGKMRHYGVFSDPVAAAVEYDRISYRLRGERSRLNFELGADGLPDSARPALPTGKPVGATGYTSRFVGVHFHRGRKQWQARIRHLGVLRFLGSFAEEALAAAAYDDAALKLRGSAAAINFFRDASGAADLTRPTGARMGTRSAVRIPSEPRVGVRAARGRGKARSESAGVPREKGREKDESATT